jgi:hypothetical protein
MTEDEKEILGGMIKLGIALLTAVWLLSQKMEKYQE